MVAVVLVAVLLVAVILVVVVVVALKVHPRMLPLLGGEGRVPVRVRFLLAEVVSLAGPAAPPAEVVGPHLRMTRTRR